jgi:hypothetical protein
MRANFPLANKHCAKYMRSDRTTGLCSLTETLNEWAKSAEQTHGSLSGGAAKARECGALRALRDLERGSPLAKRLERIRLAGASGSPTGRWSDANLFPPPKAAASCAPVLRSTAEGGHSKRFAISIGGPSIREACEVRRIP